MYFIVINPMCERGQSILRLPVLTSLFDAKNIPYEVHITTAVMDGYNKTLKFCKRHPDCKGIIGIGGDGTMQEIAAGMVDAFPESRQGKKIPIPLGILPFSSGNDFLLTLEGGKDKAYDKYKKAPEIVIQNFFETLMKGHLRTVDVITAGDRAFLNIGHVGLDAKIAHSAELLKEKHAENAYKIAAFKGVLGYESIRLAIETTEINSKTTMEGSYTLAAICNGQYYGGGMRITPTAQIDNGKITLCLMKHMSRLKFFFTLINIISEKHERMKKISFISCGALKLTVPPTIICLDGNIYPIEGDVEFKVLPGVLDVFSDSLKERSSE